MGRGICSGHVLCRKVILVSILPHSRSATLQLPCIDLSMPTLPVIVLSFRVVADSLLVLVESAVVMVTRVSPSTSVSRTLPDPVRGDKKAEPRC